MLHRQPLDAEAIGADRPAGLGLPPMVDDRHLELLLGPRDGRRIGALAGEKQGAKPPEVVGADQLPSGSSRLIARNAVGAVKKTRTSCSSMTRQKAPASGVPTGFPSYMTEVQPWISGPYTM